MSFRQDKVLSQNIPSSPNFETQMVESLNNNLETQMAESLNMNLETQMAESLNMITNNWFVYIIEFSVHVHKLYTTDNKENCIQVTVKCTYNKNRCECKIYFQNRSTSRENSIKFILELNLL